MADKRPRRQRKVRSSTEFFGAGLLHKEEIELRKALNASLREVRNPHPKKQEKSSESLATTSTRSACTDTNRSGDQKEGKPDKPVVKTKTVCTGTNTKFRIKSDRTKKSDNTNKEKGNSIEKNKAKGKRRQSDASWKRSQVLDTSLKRKECGEIACGSLKKKKKEIEETESEASQTSCKVLNNSLKRKYEEAAKGGKVRSKKSKSVAWKELESPTKTHKVAQSSRGKKLKILAKGKAAKHESLDNRKLKATQKSKVVQSLTEKFSATVRTEKQSSTEKKKGSEGQRVVVSCGDGIKKKKSSLLNDNIEKSEQNSGSSEVTSNPEKICELRQHVSNAFQGKVRRRLKHVLKNRRLVSPLGEIYIPANVAKTEDFLTFLCLRGNSSLPRCFDVFKDPDPFFTQAAHQFPGDTTLSCPALPMQSSVIYSPPSSCPPSESSAASPMSSVDSWMLNDD